MFLVPQCFEHPIQNILLYSMFDKKFGRLIDLRTQLSEGGGGTCQHLSGLQFFLLNGSILVVHLSTYNG